MKDDSTALGSDSTTYGNACVLQTSKIHSERSNCGHYTPSESQLREVWKFGVLDHRYLVVLFWHLKHFDQAFDRVFNDDRKNIEFSSRLWWLPSEFNDFFRIVQVGLVADSRAVCHLIACKANELSVPETHAETGALDSWLKYSLVQQEQKRLMSQGLKWANSSMLKL